MTTTELQFTNGRTANHVLITDSGTVHYAADAKIRPYHVLACNGRAMSGGGVGGDNAPAVTCKACRKLERVA